VTETETGVIIYTQTGRIPQTGEKYGIITIKTSEDEKIRLKINDSTYFKELTIGAEVTAVFEETNDSKFPVAVEVRINA
jgi:uncharacterized OB-fold protein